MDDHAICSKCNEAIIVPEEAKDPENIENKVPVLLKYQMTCECRYYDIVCTNKVHRACAPDVTRQHEKGRQLWFCSTECDKAFRGMKSSGYPDSSDEDYGEYGDEEYGDEFGGGGGGIGKGMAKGMSKEKGMAKGMTKEKMGGMTKEKMDGMTKEKAGGMAKPAPKKGVVRKTKE